jgi:hypothetical protein
MAVSTVLKSDLQDAWALVLLRFCTANTTIAARIPRIGHGSVKMRLFKVEPRNADQGGLQSAEGLSAFVDL